MIILEKGHNQPHSHLPSHHFIMGNKSSRVNSPLYANASPRYHQSSRYSCPSGSLYSASGTSRTANATSVDRPPADRGMLYCKTKNTINGPTPTVLYGKKKNSTYDSPVPTPTNLYSKVSTASIPTPTSLYSRKSTDSLHHKFPRSSVSRSGGLASGASIGCISPYAMSSALEESGSCSSVVALQGIRTSSCKKCRMPFNDSTTAFCRDCGRPRSPESVPIAMAQRMSDGRHAIGVCTGPF